MALLFPASRTPAALGNPNSSSAYHRSCRPWLPGHRWPLYMCSLASILLRNVLSCQHLQIGTLRTNISRLFWEPHGKSKDLDVLALAFLFDNWLGRSRYGSCGSCQEFAAIPTPVSFIPAWLHSPLTCLASVDIGVCEIWAHARGKVCLGRLYFLICCLSSLVILLSGRKGLSKECDMH